MKKLLFTLLIGISALSYAQAPQKISYQGVARNTSGAVIANQPIGIKFDIHQGSASGPIVFTETHTGISTNGFGLFTTYIGSISNLAVINWSTNSYFIEVSIDPNTGTYSSLGSQQLMSVPYALNAGSAPAPTVTFTNNILSVGGNTTTIPSGTTYTAGTGINVTGSTISNTAPDQAVVLNAAGATTVTGTYPSFTINTPTTQVYTAGNGIDITSGVITNTAIATTPTIIGAGTATVTSSGNTFTVNTPVSQVYTAGNGIDITSGVISNTATAVTPTIVGTGATTVTGTYPNLTINTPTVAPDQAVSLTGIGNATVTGAYPNFTVNVPSSALPNAFNGQFLYNTGTIWDTLPRNNLYFDGTNFGIGTTSPQANFHVVGAGRFDASISTPQIFTDNIKITGGTAGQVLTSDATGNGTWQTPVAPANPTITSTGIAVVTPTTGNTFNVDVPVPVLSYTSGTNVLSLSQGTTVTTATLNGTGSNTVSIVGVGLATVTPTTGSTFTVSVPNPTLSIGSGSLSISNGNAIPLPTQSLSINSNSLTISGTGGNTVVLPTASTTSLTQGSNVTVVGSAPNYTVSAPAYSISLPGGNTVQITNGTSTSTAAIATTSLTLTGVNNNILSAGGNTVTLNTYTAGTGIAISGTAPNYTLSSPNQSLTINSNSLSITGGNTITLPTSSTTTLTQGTNVIVAGSAPSYTVSAVTPTLSVVGGTLTGSYPTQTLTVPTSSTTVLTQSTGISVLGSAPSYTVVNTAPAVTQTLTGTGISSVTAAANTFTVNTPMPTYTQTTGVLSFGGTNTVVATPSLSIVGNILRSGPATNTVNLPATVLTGTGTGIATVTTAATNFTVNVPSPTYTAATGVLSFGGTNTVVVSPTLSLTGTTLTSGPATNSVNLATMPGLWSVVGSTNVTTTNSLSLVGIGTGTTSPTYKLDVYATGSVPATIHGYNSGATSSSTGIFGENPNNGIGVYGQSNSGKGVWGTSTSDAGVYGESTSGDGGKFILPSNTTTASAVNAQTNGNGPALYARTYNTNPGALAAKFEGHVLMAGKAKIDSSLSMAAYNIPPNPSFPNEGRIYYDRPLNQFMVSENSGAYKPLFGASPWIQGAGIVTQGTLGDKVGIGTNTPNASLDIKNNAPSLDGLALDITNVSNGSNGLQLRHYGIGNAAYIEVNNPSSNAKAIEAITNSSGATIGASNSGSGLAGIFAISSASNSSSALFATTNGGGVAVQGHNGGPGGGAAEFKIFNNSNNAHVLFSQTAGLGAAGFFEVINSSSNANAVSAHHYGAGATIIGNNYGSGGAGNFAVVNATNTANALQVSTNGMGPAAYIYNSNGSNTNAALQVNQVSTGVAIYAVNSNNTSGSTAQFDGNSGSTTFNAINYSSGSAINASAQGGNAIYASSNGSAAPTIYANNSGTGDAMQIYSASGGQRAIYAANNSPAYSTIEASNAGTGAVFTGNKNTGTTGGNVASFSNASSTNAADAVFVTNSGAGAALHTSSSATSTLGLWVQGGHIRSTQTTAPIASSVSVSGITSVALTPTGCTDVKGNILAVVTHSGNINSGNSVTYRVTFNKAYATAPTVILTPTTDFGFLYYYVSGITTTSFNVTIRSNTAGTESRTNFGLNYMVIE